MKEYLKAFNNVWHRVVLVQSLARTPDIIISTTACGILLNTSPCKELPPGANYCEKCQKISEKDLKLPQSDIKKN